MSEIYQEEEPLSSQVVTRRHREGDRCWKTVEKGEERQGLQEGNGNVNKYQEGLNKIDASCGVCLNVGEMAPPGGHIGSRILIVTHLFFFPKMIFST